RRKHHGHAQRPGPGDLHPDRRGSVFTQSGTNSVTVSAAPVQGVALDSSFIGGGNNTFTVNLGNLAGGGGVTARPGSTNTLVINGTAANEHFDKFIDLGLGTVVRWLNSPNESDSEVVLYDLRTDHVVINAGEGNDTITDPGQDTTILGGPGDDT